MKHQCALCQLNNVYNQIKKFNIPQKTADRIINQSMQIIIEQGDKLVPYTTGLIHKNFKKIIGVEDLYREEKDFTNKLILETYNNHKELIKNSPSPLHAALKLTVIGNIIDFGANSVPEDIIKEIHTNFQQDFKINHSNELLKDINKADLILYLGDNSGEIVFDKLFPETLNHQNVVFSTRGEAILNDVTTKDAYDIGLDKYAKIISNGYFAPSTLIDKSGKEFMDIYKKADVIISKGQGNLEGLLPHKKDNIYFLLMAKCQLIADILKVQKGDLLIASNKILSHNV